MIASITYTTRSGDTDAGTTFTLCRGDGHMLQGDLSSWAWSVDSSTGAMSRAAKDYTTSIGFYPEDGLDATARANLLFALADKDAANGIEGTLTINGWSLRCNIIKGQRVDYLNGAVYSVTFRASTPLWRRSTVHQLRPSSGSSTITTGLDYPTDYEFDYAGTAVAQGVGEFDISADCAIGVTFYGACSSPYVRVTSQNPSGTTTNLFGVDADASDGERIIIDPLGRSTIGGSVYKMGQFGESTNLFDKRRRGIEGSGSYVFQAMPSGTLTVSWPQDIGVDLTTIEERGALPWS